MRKSTLTQISDRGERDLIEGELHLTRCWLYERQRNSREIWELVRGEAEKLLNLAQQNRLPRRLRAEGLFQVGRAAFHLGDSEPEQEFVRDRLTEAKELASADGRVKIEAACSLALAESYLQSGMIGEARFHWQAARQLPAAQSVCVTNWVQDLAPKVGGDMVFGALKPFEEAEAAFKRLYVSYHEARVGHRGFSRELEAETNMSKATYHRWKNAKPPKKKRGKSHASKS